jgi:hypothetical protein
VNAQTTQPHPNSVNIEMWVSACVVHRSPHLTTFPPDSAHTMSEDVMLMEMPGAFERGQHDSERTRPDIILLRFVVDAN